MPVRFLSDAELARLSGWPDEIADEDLVTYFALTGDDLGWPTRCRSPTAERAKVEIDRGRLLDEVLDILADPLVSDADAGRLIRARVGMPRLQAARRPTRSPRGFALPVSRPSFHLAQHTRDGCTVLELAGDLDQRSAPELTVAVHALIAASPALRLVLDLTALTSWDSSGVAALITARQRISGNPAAAMILAGVSDQFKQRLRAIGRTSQFTLADTTGQALRQIMPPE
jgi:anti-anti-sigma factor